MGILDWFRRRSSGGDSGTTPIYTPPPDTSQGGQPSEAGQREAEQEVGPASQDIEVGDSGGGDGGGGNGSGGNGGGGGE